MRTLSIRQPWAWLITRPDLMTPAERVEARARDLIKPVENRDWGTAWRGEFLIHASKGLVLRDYHELAEQLEAEMGIVLPQPEQLHRGGVVGRAVLVDVVTAHPSRFFVGPLGWVLAQAEPVPFHPCKGQLGWFDVPRDAVLKG